jgi:UDPglucose 6-dehydrogenase
MTTPTLNITMIGTGYVGLVSGASFAELGFHVTCMDVDEVKIHRLQNKGEIPIHEPGLEEVVQRNVEAGRLSFTTDLKTAVPQSDVVFIAVGTPQGEDGSADMRYVLQAARDVAPHLDGYTVIVNKSTVPVGTGLRVEEAIRETNPEAEFDVVSNPEFLREGCALKDFLEPDRVVVGVPNALSLAVMKQVYAPLMDQGVPLISTNRETSEIIKYAANAYLASKITFINEIAALCDAVGADVQDVSLGLGLDRRIGSRFLQPGPGYGGSCFPKDTHAIAKTAQDYGCPLTLVEQTIEANRQIKQAMVDRIVSACGGSVKGKRLAILGLAFKAGTDDMREAPALEILPKLKDMGAEVHAFDPAAMPRAKELMPDLTYHQDIWQAAEHADGAVILTEWQAFKDMDLTRLSQTLTSALLVDLRNLLDPSKAEAAGLAYFCIGRPHTSGRDVKAEQTSSTTTQVGKKRVAARRKNVA